MREQLALLPGYLTGHLQLTLLSLLVATAISLPLGVLATRSPPFKQVVLGVAGVIQTVPGLALLAVMVPLLSALGMQGIGFLPAFIGVTLYCLLPILFGTVTGISEVDPAMVEAARGVGMTRSQRLRMVEIPLATPTIIAGLRTASMWCVGMVTLSTPVGAPSLGNYIFGGLQTRNYMAVGVGCAAAALLAQLLDRLWQMIDVGLRRRRRALVVAAGAVFAALFLLTGVTLASAAFGGGRPIRVGAKTFTEQYVLSEIIAQRLRARTGLEVETLPSLGSTVAFDALVSGDIDLYVDYSGTIWATIMHRRDVPGDREEVRRAVGDYLRDQHQITLVATLGFENTYALAMRREQARRLGIERISQLAVRARDMDIGGDYEFFGRQEWASIEERYGLVFRRERSMDPALMYQAVAEKHVDVISAYSTDGRVASHDLRVLEDDRHAIPPYDALILAGSRLSSEHPEVVEALRDLEGSIDADEMRRMNQRVDGEGQTPASVAARFLESR